MKIILKKWVSVYSPKKCQDYLTPTKLITDFTDYLITY